MKGYINRNLRGTGREAKIWKGAWFYAVREGIELHGSEGSFNGLTRVIDITSATRNPTNSTQLGALCRIQNNDIPTMEVLQVTMSSVDTAVKARRIRPTIDTVDPTLIFSWIFQSY